MKSSVVRPGDILVASLPSQLPPGHEQTGVRPVIAVAVPSEPMRYPVIVVVPLTTQAGPWADRNPSLYYLLQAGTGGLPCDSTVLVDQLRSLDVRRVAGYLGSLEFEDTLVILRNVKAMFSP